MLTSHATRYVSEATFGDHVGGLLISQAHCEEIFEGTNCIDAVHMEPLDSDMFESPAQKRDAYRNAQRIRANVMKLVHAFKRDDMQIKLQREFRDVYNRPQQNELSSFTNQFDKTKSLWYTKLATSLEEHNRMQEQVETSSKRVKELSEQLKVKKENLEKYVKESKEAKE